MDPDASLEGLLSALADRDWDQVRELSDALLTWMERGGVPPETIGPSRLGKNWHQTIATFVCHAAVAHANDAAKRRRQNGGRDDAP